MRLFTMFKHVARLTLAVIVLSFALPVFAWDDTGHKITGYIAWQRMTPEVRERVFKILLEAPEDSDIATFYLSYGARSQESKKREYFVLMTAWGDIIRDRNQETRYKNYHHSNWHYDDTFWEWKDGRVHVVETKEDGGQAMKKLLEYNQLIRSAAPDAEKAVAIAWMEHLIGDLHQPLHTSARVTSGNPKGDQGGNLFLLTPKGTKRENQLNLHSFWDGIIGRTTPNSDDECDAEYIDPIAKEIMDSHPYSKLQGRLKLNAIEDWQKESFALATTEAYTGVDWFEIPSDKYRKKVLKISEEQLALAGYRMGELFNQAFGAAAATAK
jgi:hypothetical protein